MGDMKIFGDRRYWFIRTSGGRYFDDFFKNGFIALNWDKINDIELIRAAKEDYEAYDKLTNFIKKAYPNEKRHTNTARQIIQFVNEIKKGDIILIPDRGTVNISIGEVESDDLLPFELVTHDGKQCPWEKRKKVLWRKTVERGNVDPYLYKLFYSQYAVTNADYYAPYIDRLISSFFIKGNRAHTILNVKQKEDISAIEFANLLSKSLTLLNEFNEETNSGLDLESIKVKVNVQSAGMIELVGAIGPIWVLTIFIGLAGGKYDFKLPFGVEASIDTKGLLDKIYAFREQKHRHQTENRQLGAALAKLEVQLPQEVVGADSIDVMQLVACDMEDSHEPRLLESPSNSDPDTKKN
ncbi:MAG: hypothetical protein WA118_08395 [Carboxydocellales bacterium]